MNETNAQKVMSWLTANGFIDTDSYADFKRWLLRNGCENALVLIAEYEANKDKE